MIEDLIKVDTFNWKIPQIKVEAIPDEESILISRSKVHEDGYGTAHAMITDKFSFSFEVDA